MQILIALDDTSGLEIGDDLTDASGISGIVIHVQPDHVVVDTALAGNEAQTADNAVGCVGVSAEGLDAQKVAQMTRCAV